MQGSCRARMDRSKPNVIRGCRAFPPDAPGRRTKNVARGERAVLPGVPLRCNLRMARREAVRHGNALMRAERAARTANAVGDARYPFMIRPRTAPPPHLASRAVRD